MFIATKSVYNLFRILFADLFLLKIENSVGVAPIPALNFTLAKERKKNVNCNLTQQCHARYLWCIGQVIGRLGGYLGTAGLK